METKKENSKNLPKNDDGTDLRRLPQEGKANTNKNSCFPKFPFSSQSKRLKEKISPPVYLWSEQEQEPVYLWSER